MSAESSSSGGARSRERGLIGRRRELLPGVLLALALFRRDTADVGSDCEEGKDLGAACLVVVHLSLSAIRSDRVTFSLV